MRQENKEAELALVGPPPTVEPPRPARTGTTPDVTLPGLWQTFRRGIWLIALVTLAAVLFAGVALKLKDPVYEAGMTVAPASRDPATAGRLAAELEQYAGLAALGQTPGKFEPVSTLDRYLALMTSSRVAERLSDQPALLAALVRARWDEETTSWQPPDAWVDRIRSAVAGFFGFPDWREPEPAMVAERLADELDVEGVLGIYRLTLNLPDPAVGVRLLEAMHGAADGILRDEALAETRAQIEELEARLEGETDPTRRTALEDLLARRYQAEATLSAGRAFAADLIDPPAASGWPASLHPLLVLAFAAFVGVIVGGFVVFLRDALRRGTT